MSETHTIAAEDTPRTLPIPQPKPPLVAGGRALPIIPSDIDQVWRLATIIAESGMAPKDFKTQAQITVAIMHGLEIGLSPLQALQRIAIINGRPAVWGDAVIGLVEARNAAEYIVEEIKMEGGEQVAYCRTKRKGRPNEVVRKFSVSQAKRARLWDERPVVRRYRNNQPVDLPNDSPWYRFPERMLQMRARGLCIRDVYPDILGGMYLVEELEEPGDNAIDITPVEAQPARKAPAPPPGVGGVIDGEHKPAEVAKPVDLDIPPALRRSRNDVAQPMDEHAEVDESDWLESLENAYGACNDLNSLNQAVAKYAEPMMQKASDEGWDTAKMIFDRHSERIRLEP